MFHVYGPQFDWKISIAMTYIFVKVMQDGMAWVHLFMFYILFNATTVSRNEPQSTVGDSYQLGSSSEFPLNAHALLLEIAALAIKKIDMREVLSLENIS